MPSLETFDAFFRQAEGAFSNNAPEHRVSPNATPHNALLIGDMLRTPGGSASSAASISTVSPSPSPSTTSCQLSSSLAVRILLIGAPPQKENSLCRNPLTLKNFSLARDAKDSREVVNQENDSAETKVQRQSASGEEVTFKAATREQRLHDGFYNGFEMGSASALPSPHDASLPDGFARESAEQLSLRQLHNVLERTGYQVALWPEGSASLINAVDLLAFDVVLLQSRQSDEDGTISFCRFLRPSVEEAGATLLVASAEESGSLEAAHHAIRVLDAGADGVIDDVAALYHFSSVLRSLSQLTQARRELQMTREQLRLQLQNDDLTNLLNRRFFFQAAHREYERARRTDAKLSCLMVDVDHFRRLGESFGFACCDAVLREVACILREVARDGDIVARFGEAKFVLLLPDTTLSQAARFGEMFQREVAIYPFLWHGQALSLSVSIGEATRHTPHEDTDQNPLSEKLEVSAPLSAREEVAVMLEEADAALFVAKRGVRSTSLLEATILAGA